MYYEKKKSDFLGTFVIIVFLIVIIAILIILIDKIDLSYPTQEETEETGTDVILNEFDIENLMKNSIYSVVGISKLSQANTSIFVENSEEKLGIGSGIIVTSNGYILANQSIVGSQGSTCYVTLKNGENYVAEVVWTDETMDVAIIKIAANNLITLGQGDSDDINLGEEIYMISNPTGYDFNQSIQTGIISELNKTFKIINDDTSSEYIEDVIKINFSIESSKTGSPVLNSDGELIGISSSKLNSVIPINRLKNIINRFEEESFSEAYIGLHGFDYDTIKYLGLDLNIKSGIYIEKIEEDSPVYGQILSGDILQTIDGIEINRMQDLSSYIYTKNSGDTVTIGILRKTEFTELEIKLGEK